MIVCPNCNHSNPDGAQACEACYTPLPTTTNCPNCGAPVQTDASFCGQCGYNLSLINAAAGATSGGTLTSNTTATEPIAATPVSPEPLVQSQPLSSPTSPPSSTPAPVTIVSQSEPVTGGGSTPPSQQPPAPSSQTQLQQQTTQLLHVQTNTVIELPQNLSVIHIGKQNDRIPPDVDVSGFPNSEVVSRIHADIRVEGDAYYLEDVGSSNGTYINNMPLPPGNRHRLRAGDRIALGKGDLVTFLFQVS